MAVHVMMGSLVANPSPQILKPELFFADQIQAAW